MFDELIRADNLHRVLLRLLRHFDEAIRNNGDYVPGQFLYDQCSN
jgi:hypothetical protein